MFSRKKKIANPELDRTAQNIIVRLVKLQVTYADRLQRQSEKLSRRGKCIVTVMGILFATLYCLFIIINAIRS